MRAHFCFLKIVNFIKLFLKHGREILLILVVPIMGSSSVLVIYTLTLGSQRECSTDLELALQAVVIEVERPPFVVQVRLRKARDRVQIALQSACTVTDSR